MEQIREVALPESESAFTELSTQARFGSGEHVDYRLTANDVDIELGSEEFDPAYHDVADIDFSLEDSIATGDLYVPSGLSSRPMIVNIVQDSMKRTEDPGIRKAKHNLAEQLAVSIHQALPQTDPIEGTVLMEHTANRHDFYTAVEVENRADGVDKIQRLALGGLSLVISDFKNMEFAPGSMQDVLAIKVNHLLEREVPRNIGTLKLGGQMELNTDKRRDVRNYNQMLAEKHDGIVEGLQQAGAHVVPVVADGRVKPHGFDVAAADAQLAAAIEATSR